MKQAKSKRGSEGFLLAAAILLMLIGVALLAQTFANYSALSLERQDAQLNSMVRSVDEVIASQLGSIRKDLEYVLKRRGFIQAEAEWTASGDAAELLVRMQENLVAENPLIRTILLIQDGEIRLSSDGNTDYFFPDSGNGHFQACIAGDGTLYLAVKAETACAVYGALLDTDRWYSALTPENAGEGSRLLLLGHRGIILMHQWLGKEEVALVESLTENNCDLQAVQLMLKSRTTGMIQTGSYPISYPGDSYVHEMRMTVIPAEECANGYFSVGLTSDYDDVVRPMQSAAVRVVGFGGMVVLGVLLTAALLLAMLRQNRHRDMELQRLQTKNAQIQQLLEKTQELAHHQRLETIGTLTASIAHEFNNLLTPIMGYAILTLEGLPEEADELADHVTEIYEASRKAKSIISRLSELSRKNAEDTFVSLSLEEMVNKALAVAAPARPAHVESCVLCEKDCRIMGNETQCSQLLLNLILNAFHAMQGQGGTLTMQIKQNQTQAMLIVRDTGVGIAEEILPRIFDPFFTTKESGRGTGLGLAIVQQVMDSHGGAIAVESKPGEGTVFTLTFPLAANQENLNEY